MVRDEPPPGAGVTDYLFSLKPRGSKLGLDRMRLLADEIGHPERGLPVIHVAGTNGKGSVSAMLESILRAAGWRTGLYTSPHLVHLGERVQVDRQPLADTEIAAFVRELDPAADRVASSSGAEDRPSFFEFMTAMAFLQFARRRCEIGVIEVGLGGQFDATNIVMPEVSVITSIGLDHCEWLGSTIAQIATAKAGIIKAGRPVVLGRMPPEAEQIMRDTAARRAAPVSSVRDVFGEDVTRCPVTNLEGEYQRWNAATATVAARALAPHWRVTDDAIGRGLKNVVWVGRWDRRRIGGRTVILDASHNPEGAAELDRNLAQLVAETGRRPWVLTGVLGAERAGPLLASICRHARHVALAVPRQPRACSYEELERLIPAEFAAGGGRVGRTTVEAAFPDGGRCALGGPDDVVVVTGSIYLLGEVMARLEPAAADGR